MYRQDSSTCCTYPSFHSFKTTQEGLFPTIFYMLAPHHFCLFLIPLIPQSWPCHGMTSYCTVVHLLFYFSLPLLSINQMGPQNVCLDQHCGPNPWKACGRINAQSWERKKGIPGGGNISYVEPCMLAGSLR